MGIRKLLSCIVVSVILMTSACSAPLPTQEPVTISFVYPEDPSGRYEMWAQQFQEAYPYITLELKDTTQISYDMRFAKMFLWHPNLNCRSSCSRERS